jgi:hypothetical protein
MWRLTALDVLIGTEGHVVGIELGHWIRVRRRPSWDRQGSYQGAMFMSRTQVDHFLGVAHLCLVYKRSLTTEPHVMYAIMSFALRNCEDVVGVS